MIRRNVKGLCLELFSIVILYEFGICINGVDLVKYLIIFFILGRRLISIYFYFDHLHKFVLVFQLIIYHNIFY